MNQFNRSMSMYLLHFSIDQLIPPLCRVRIYMKFETSLGLYNIKKFIGISEKTLILRGGISCTLALPDDIDFSQKLNSNEKCIIEDTRQYIALIALHLILRLIF